MNQTNPILRVAPQLAGDVAAYPLTIDIDAPDSRARWSVMARLPLGLPVLFFSLLLNIGATLAIWAAILVSGRIPAWLFAYQVNVGRWHTRAAVYLLVLSDHYPVLDGEHLRHTAARSSRWACRISAVIGLAPAVAIVGFLVFIVGFTGTHVTSDISYTNLRSGETTSTAIVESGAMRLESVQDPADGDLGLFRPDAETRYVAFTISIHNRRSAGETVPIVASSFRLEDAHGERHAPVLVGVDGVPGPGSIGAGRTGNGLVVFQVAGEQPPNRLSWDVVDYTAVPRRGETIEWIFR